ncbi:MAG: tetratricopeptide repeat protein [bacterium]|nr:tetratricopeptide repeat protein [bacterium]
MEILTPITELIDELPDSLDAFLERPDCDRPAVVRRYLEKVESIRANDPREALGLADAGRLLAGRIPQFHPREERFKVRAQSLAVWGGIHRTMAHFDHAEVAYLFAYELLRQVARPIDCVELLGRLAFLRRDQRRLPEAREFAEEALTIARDAGDVTWMPRALVFVANIIERANQEEAIPHYREALRYLTFENDPLYYRSAAIGMATVLCSSPEPDPAELGPLVERVLEITPESATLRGVHVRWLQGLAFRKTRRCREAEDCFRTACDGLLHYGMPTYAAAATMDLALLFLEQAQHNEATKLAGDIFPFFHALRHDREAIKSLKVFVDAALGQQLTIELVQEIRDDLSRPEKRGHGQVPAPLEHC